ncbi:MAG: Rne/Rng family ribonuclease [Nitrospirae bacterium]|nr:Rne/Rng family ribonuclease [Nitrospirota bacterium]
MYKEVLISVDENEVRMALLEDKVLEELFVERKEGRGIAGNIYKGRVEAILPGMEAAFVDIGLEKSGFLYVSDVAKEVDILEDMVATYGEEEAHRLERGKRSYPSVSIEDVLKKGQEILVQIIKEPMGTKGARISSHISLPGRFLVLMPTVEHLGVSRKIVDRTERERLKKILQKIRPPGVGFIVRTAGEGKGKKELLPDIRYLMDLWRRVEKTAQRYSAPHLIHEELELICRAARDFFGEDINRVIIDSREEGGKLRRFLKSFLPALRPRVETYRREQSLFSAYHLENEIEKALNNKVWLKSGGNLIIEETTALISVDVNTGRYVGRENLEQTALRINLEAAQEIARQLRLRDLGGIIIIDFIDMESERNRKRVLRKLEESLKRDRSKTSIVQYSSLGLVEMTRQRTRENLSRVLCNSCSYCQGRGVVKSIITISIDLQRKLKAICSRTEEKEIIVKAHPQVVSHLLKEDREKIAKLEKQFRRKKILIKEDHDLQLEKVKFLSSRGEDLDSK